MKNDNIFWIGYSDIMTSLFFVMLVMFVITIGYLKNNSETTEEQLEKIQELQTAIQDLKYNLEATEEQLEKIQELQTAIQELPEHYFEYQPEYKRFKLNKQIQFESGSSYINSKYHKYLIEVGSSISNLITELKKQENFEKLDIKYLVVIEGMASKDNYLRNYELSYERALSLYRFWKYIGITFNATDCEIQISGSGTEGIREHAGKNEYKNQQFLIHIIPKMGKIQDEK